MEPTKIEVKLRSPQSLKNLKSDIVSHAPAAQLNKGPRVNVLCLPTFVRLNATDLAQLDQMRLRCQKKKERFLILNRSGGGEKPKLPIFPELDCEKTVFGSFPMKDNEMSELLCILQEYSRNK